MAETSSAATGPGRSATTRDAVVVAVTGSRRGCTSAQRRAMSTLIRIWGTTLLVHGDCVGVDAEADAIAARHGIRRVCLPSWLGSTRAHTSAEEIAAPAHPLDRNRQIVLMADVIIAVPREGSRGTWHAWNVSRSLGLPGVIIGEDGRAVSGPSRG